MIKLKIYKGTKTGFLQPQALKGLLPWARGLESIAYAVHNILINFIVRK